MRLRTGHGPNDWTDNIPGEAHTSHSGYVARPAAVLGGMTPILSQPVMSEERREQAREAAKRYRDRMRVNAD